MAGLIGRLDAPDFPRALDAALRRLVPYDLSVVFAYPDESPPLLLHDGLGDTGEAGAMDAYLGGTHLLDPFYLACARRIEPGLYRMRALAPDRFFESDYALSPQVHPCISMQSGSLAEEIGFLVALPSGYMAAYSLMRRHGCPPFDAPALARLRAVWPVVERMVTRHWRFLPRAPGARGRPSPGDAPDLEAAFASFAPDRLTPRQRRIVQLALRGHGNASIGAHLGISEATAKTHRRAIHTRLGISSQSELFALFVRHVLAGR